MSENSENNELPINVMKGSGPVAGAAESNEVHAPRTARSASGVSGAAGNGGTVRKNRRNVPRARRMSLSVTRIDAWSAAKVSFMLSVAGGIIQVVAAGLVWAMLNLVGVFDSVTQLFSSTGLDVDGLDLESIFTLPTVLSAVTIFSIVEVVLVTILVTIGAMLYNVASTLVGGLHVTLGDD